MGFFSNFFKGEPVSEELNPELQMVIDRAQRLTDIINESLHLASDSKNPDTKLYRLEFAKEKVEDIKKLAEQNSFLNLTSLGEVETTILELENEFMMSGLREIANGNYAGEEFEKKGKVDEAIKEYEKLVEKGVDTPFTYRRLAILYRKAKKREDELRVIKAALDSVPISNLKHYNWFKDRLVKMAK